LPNLKTLSLQGTRKTPYFNESHATLVDFFFATLPRGLTKLRLEWGASKSMEKIEFATRRFAAQLPPLLESLGFVLIGEILELPRSKLSANKFPDALNVDAKHWPHMYLSKGHFPDHWPLFLPSGLTTISFSQNSRRWEENDEPSDLDWLTHLPATLTKLICDVGCVIPIHMLPKSLTHFDLKGNCDWDGGRLPNLKSLSSNQWPPSAISVPVLEHLHLIGHHMPYFLDLDDFYQTMEWPERLTSLNISHRAVRISAMMPTSTTALTLDMDFAIDPFYIRESHLSLPTTLVSLTLHQIRGISLGFFDRQWPLTLKTLILSHKSNSRERPSGAEPRLGLLVLERLPPSLTHLHLDWNVHVPLGPNARFPPNLRVLSLENTPFEVMDLPLLPSSLEHIQIHEIRCGTLISRLEEGNPRDELAHEQELLEALNIHFALIPDLIKRFPSLQFGDIPFAISRRGLETFLRLFGTVEANPNLMIKSPIGGLLERLPSFNAHYAYLRHLRFEVQEDHQPEDSFILAAS
jgi:hypothetical protein